MAFRDFPDQQQGIQLLQRSLTRGRLGHAYLFVGHQIAPLETLAATLSKTLNCQNPVRKDGATVDCCDQCVVCRKIDHGNHADIHWVRPEMKSRIVSVDQMRELMRQIQLKPTEAKYKTGIIVGADRMGPQAANAFLKTLEEPPPNSILILLTTEPQRLLETIVSRCLRLNFGGEVLGQLPPENMQWLMSFTNLAAGGQKSLISRYRLMDVLLQKLNHTKTSIEEKLKARSPLQQYEDAEADMLERWEKELAAAVEAEYRRQRSDLLALVQAWLRDVWMESTLSKAPSTLDGALQLLNFPQLDETRKVAARVSPAQAMENLEIIEQLQRWLHTNVQEALALEVGMLKLRF